ncbi:YbfB/YjiJ family MFS transporter [uncultured Cocleimonas sp.]|uniref:YbfB/YjiJ family MFS transporter n=1 Tax=uncultured Cocleimonas sp. TaxID=1051587 RepID=UPI0026096266|nr:YbfB/YjiJ family MFS transporter [uncultured Cocleimonas sp.]
MPNSKTDHPLKVMFAGLFSLILAMGISRFSYTPLLPVMINETYLNDASGGWLATINYLGYMLGAIIAASISDLKLKDVLYRVGLIVAVLSTVGMGVTDNYIVWSIMRFIGGLSSAACLLVGTGLILNWMIRHGHKPELGIHFAGIGLGISLTAILSMMMLNKLDWAQQWYVYSAIAVVIAIPAWRWLPKPVNHHQTTTGGTLLDTPPEKSWMLILYVAYFCAGIGYVISATFLVAIVDHQPELAGKGSLVWLVTGIAAAPAAILWDRIARKVGELKALFWAYGINIVGIIIPVFSHSLSGVLLSGFFFGLTFVGIVSLLLTMVGKFYPTKPAKPMGKLTLSYGIAQVVAPAMAGMIAETTGNYSMPLIFASVVMGIGMVLIVILQIRKKH